MKLNKSSILTNAHSNSKDVWDMYFGQLNKHFLSLIDPVPCYVISDKGANYPGHNFIIYYENESYSEQYLKGLHHIETEFMFTMVDDMILYNNVNIDKMNSYISFLERTNYDFVRLIKSGDVTENNIEDDLYEISSKAAYLYSMQATIWKTNSLVKLYEFVDVPIIRKETMFGDACRELNITGVCAYNGEDQRGKSHFDSSVFPYIATALRAGRWDFRVYPDIFPRLFEDYNINPQIRGIR